MADRKGDYGAPPYLLKRMISFCRAWNAPLTSASVAAK